jgi:hypothetical protein
VLALCACVAGCAATGGQPSRTPAAGVPNEARGALSIGKSTKADAIAALGKTVTVPFDSGYEVWVYHLKPGTTEFVLLFDPAGVLARTRVRTAPLP